MQVGIPDADLEEVSKRNITAKKANRLAPKGEERQQKQSNTGSKCPRERVREVRQLCSEGTNRSLFKNPFNTLKL